MGPPDGVLGDLQSIVHLLFVNLSGDHGYLTFNSIKAITIELHTKVREDFTITEKAPARVIQRLHKGHKGWAGRKA